MKKALRRVGQIAPITLLFVFFLEVVFSYCWLEDQAAFFGAEIQDISLNYLDALEKDGISGWLKEAAGTDHYPPGYVALGGMLHWLFGFSRFTFFWLNAFFLAVALAGAYGIGGHIAGKEGGFFSVLLILLCPGFYSFLPIPMTEVALTGPAVLCVYALIKSARFTNRKMVALFAFSFSVGMYLKWNTFIILLCPVVYLFAELIASGIRQGRSWKTLYLEKRQLVSALLCSGLAFALLAPWYMFVMDWGSIGKATPADPTVTAGTFGWVIYYLQQLNSTLVSPYTLWLFVAAMIAGFFYPVRKMQWMIVVWLIGGYLLFSLIPHKETRYIFWLIVPLAILASTGALSLPKKWIAYCAFTLFISYSLFYGITQFDRNWIPTDNGDILLVENAACMNTQGVWENILKEVHNDQKDTTGVVSIATHPFNKKDLLFGDEVINLYIHLANRNNSKLKLNKFGYTLFEYGRFCRDLPRIDYLLVNESVYNADAARLREDVGFWKENGPPQSSDTVPPENDPGLLRMILEQYEIIGNVKEVCFQEIKILKQKSRDHLE